MASQAVRPVGTEPMDMAFHHPELTSYWAKVDEGLHAATLHLGDAVSGPIVQLFSADQAHKRDVYGPHSHASDNFRISIRGFQPVGDDVYHEGEFRFQEGWKGYTGDNVCLGPSGGWQLMVFSDKRGVRVRDVIPNEDPDWASYIARMGEQMGIERGDLFLDDRFDEPGPAGLVTTLKRRKPYVNGSFADTESWLDSGQGHRLTAALMSNPVSGPVIVLARTEPGVVSTPPCTFGTDVLRVVIAGSAEFGEITPVAGDMRLYPKGVPTEAVVAGHDGLCEFVLFGDRRGIGVAENVSGGWLPAFTGDLMKQLKSVRTRP